MAKDKTRIDRFVDRANVHKHLLHSANHLNFTDLPLILNSVFSKRFGLFGEGDGLDLSLKISAIMIDFLDKKN